MAKITVVDYEAIPGQTNQMRAQARELNSEMTNAYASIADMHNSWFGKRYNELVKSFNNLAPQINELLDLVLGQIPFTLDTIANNYAQADTGAGITGAAKEEPKRIADIAISNDVGMRFVTSDVQTTQKKVSSNFNNAKDKMNAIESTYAKINWQSEASEAFKAKFTTLKNDIVKSFSEIEQQFVTLMNQTLEDMQATENANTVK